MMNEKDRDDILDILTKRCSDIKQRREHVLLSMLATQRLTSKVDKWFIEELERNVREISLLEGEIRRIGEEGA